MQLARILVLLFIIGLATPAQATTYFISPTGNDANNGLSSGAPWLTPNHALNCGDVVSAAAGTYAEANFRVGQYGVVTCAAGNNVAWLQCAVAFTCSITISSGGSHDALTPSQSYWGIQGWVVSVSAPAGNQCFEAFPPNSSTQIHHIIFANNIANGCGDGGFTTGENGSVGVDYLAIIGNIAYNAAQDNANCYSGIDIVSPVKSDSLPGTHYYVAGNFTWGNVDPNPCVGGLPSDGHGILLDSIFSAPGVQFVIDNNISVFNGASGVQSFSNTGGSPNSKVYIRHNTTYGNETGVINAAICAEITLNSSLSSEVYGNLVQTAAATACQSAVNLFALGVVSPDSTDHLYGNFLYSAAGNNTTGSGAGFSYGPNNLTGTSPAFANPVQPSAPSCAAFANVPACMATVIANFTPTTAAAKTYGYQAPSATSVYDPLFPQWLCSVTNLPAGLVTMGCVVGSSIH